MSYHIQHASEGIPWRWDCDTCNPEQPGKHPQWSDIVTAEGLRHIDHCYQCRQTFNVVGRIAYDEDELTDPSDTYTI